MCPIFCVLALSCFLLMLVQAPVVAHGNDLVYWDSSNARALVNARGMEYQNHWGAHDPDVELPSEQLNAFFGTRAEYWTPSAKPQAVPGHPQQPPGHPQQPAPGQGRQSVGSVLGATRDCPVERQSAVPSAASKGSSAVGNVRAQRAADRAHNEAVIASTDGQLAQALADEEAQVRHPCSAAIGIAASDCALVCCCVKQCCMECMDLAFTTAGVACAVNLIKPWLLMGRTPHSFTCVAHWPSESGKKEMNVKHTQILSKLYKQSFRSLQEVTSHHLSS